MTQNLSKELILLTPLKARRGPKGGLILTQKYLDGAAAYARYWPGPVTTLVKLDTRPDTNMDQVEIDPAKLETGLEELPMDLAERARRLEAAALVVDFLSPYGLETAQLCKRIGVPVSYVSEYTPRTERQIIDAGTRNPLKRLRRRMWQMQAERTRQQMLRNYAAGLQCSGTPTFDLYNAMAPEPFLFFDNRVPAANILNDASLAAKCDQLARGAPLRLMFGGRLIAMKGVLELPRIAQELDRLAVPYRMDIVGQGDLEESLRQKIAAAGLSARVTLHPPMDFNSGWIPMLKREADLFVCPHPQGDPSSTYPEVMSCGVPIVGYDNEAFAGIVRESGIGWSVPMFDARAMARQIGALHADRAALQQAARAGRDFARQHCLEETFSRRTAHLVKVSRLPNTLKTAASA
ncbi:MAG: glycosyltransferase [Pseudomonadota bacterium]